MKFGIWLHVLRFFKKFFFYIFNNKDNFVFSYLKNYLEILKEYFLKSRDINIKLLKKNNIKFIF